MTYMEYVTGSARCIDAKADRIEAAFQCASCKRISVGGRLYAGLDQSGPFLSQSTTPDEIARQLIGRVEYWEPVKPLGKVFEGVPAPIASAADEAHRCVSVGAHRAGILMVRGVIEATAKDRGVTAGGLASKIDALGERGLIRPVIAKAAHTMRALGNDMAHGDFATSHVTFADAEVVLRLMDDLLHEVFGTSHYQSLIDRAKPE